MCSKDLCHVERQSHLRSSSHVIVCMGIVSIFVACGTDADGWSAGASCCFSKASAHMCRGLNDWKAGSSGWKIDCHE